LKDLIRFEGFLREADCLGVLFEQKSYKSEQIEQNKDKRFERFDEI